MAERELQIRNYCGKINEDFLDKNVSVYGWINKVRELGGLTFIDIRDREGILQAVVDDSSELTDLVKKLSREDVVRVKGKIVKRSNPNKDIFTGSVELAVESIEILAKSELPPFFPEKNKDVSEELRFKYRYLDLRNSVMQKNFRLRSDVDLRVRNFLSERGFLNIETPVLTKATPEGARDYLVPSRVYKGRMFALPQSPQLFKQLLMVSGFDRYFQITKCFRDEDLRADRQPEFTQIDIEMSFDDPEILFSIIEDMIAEVFAVNNIKIEKNFRRMKYAEAMEKYGSDKPDLRIPFELRDFTEDSKKFGSNILDSIIEDKGIIKGLVMPESSKYSRKVLDNINSYVREIGGKGAVWIKKAGDVYKSSIKTDSDIIRDFYKNNDISDDEIVFLIGDQPVKANFLSGKLRNHLGMEYADENKLEFLWLTDFPLFFYNEEEDRLDSNHHPFTCPVMEDIEKLDKDPLNVNSVAYDLILNGVEVGGGSRRIHDLNLQRKIFELLGLQKEEIEEKFGFFLEALKFGAPPHLGIAFGLDRLMMLLTGENSIREIIAFPKTTSSLCLLTGSPGEISENQLNELNINLKK